MMLGINGEEIILASSALVLSIHKTALLPFILSLFFNTDQLKNK